MIRVDAFLDRERTSEYKCFDFVREVWLDTFGEDVGEKLRKFMGAVADRKFVLSDIKHCRKLAAPVDPCFVLFQRDLRLPPHVGIWCQGRVLHLGPSGAQFQPIDVVARRHPRVTYFL
jgi:hypothetical protein